MKKGVYIVDHKLGNADGGVDRKVLSQIKAFRDSGLEISLCEFDYTPNASALTKIIHRLPFSNVQPKWEYREEFGKADFIYIRKAFSNGAFVKLLREIRMNNSGAKIVMEIPTYPYDNELTKKLSLYPLYIKDLITRNKYKGLIDRIAHLGDEKEIFDIKTIHILNGFDFDRYPIRKVREPDGVINLACVAYFSPWHGYDRIIEGLHEYYSDGGTRRIVIHFVGEGEESARYKELVKNYHLEDNTVFYGKKKKDEILSIYARCDLGVASLGMYRFGFNIKGNFLKTKEYMAAGLPFLVAGEVDAMDYPELYRYIFDVSKDHINMKEIIDFYDGLYENKTVTDIESMSADIHRLAEKRFNMKAAMGGVIEYFQK